MGGGILDVPDRIAGEVESEASEAAHGFIKDITGQGRSKQQQLEDELFSSVPLGPNAGTRALGHASDFAFSPVTGTLTATAGAGLEHATGIPRRVTGDVLSIFVPLGGEVKGAKILEEAAKDPKLGAEAAVRLFRGNKQLQRNVRDMIAAGVKPNLAVAAANRGTQRMLARVAGLPLSGGEVRGAVHRTAQGVARGTEELAGQMGRTATQTEAGERVQKGVEHFAASTTEDLTKLSDEGVATLAKASRRIPARQLGFGKKADILYEQANRAVGNPKGLISLDRTMESLVKISQRFDNPTLRKVFDNSVLSNVMKGLAKRNHRATWQDARNLRTLIRTRLLSDPELRATADERMVNELYRSLSEDLEAGAYRLGGKKGGDAYAEANGYYAAGMKRIEDALTGLTGKSGDAAYAEVVRIAQSGSRRDLQRLSQIRNSLSADEWRDFSATVLDHMGLPLAGQRTATNEFSLATFLTNFNKLSAKGARPESGVDSGLKLLFDGAGRGADLKRLEALASTSGMFRDLRKFENMSHSGEQSNFLGEIAAAAVAGHFSLPAAVTAMTVGWMGERAMMSEAFVRWLAKLPQKGGVEEIDKAMAELGDASKKDSTLTPIYHYLANHFAQAGEAAHRLPEDVHGETPADQQAPGSPGAAPQKPAGPDPFSDIWSGKAQPSADAAPKQGGDMDAEPAAFTPNDQVADYLKYHLGFPVKITSGYRDPAHNREVGGAEHSQHMKGEAWDFVPQGVSIANAARQVIDSGMDFDQLEITPNHLHISFDPANRHSIVYGGRQLALVNPDHFSPHQVGDMQDDDDLDMSGIQ